MLIGLCELFIYLPNSHSLKDKRSIIKSFKTFMRRKYNISITEIGHKDSRKKSTIGIGCIGDNRKFIQQVIDRIIQDADCHPEFQLVNFQRTII